MSDITLTATVSGNDITVTIPENTVNLDLNSTGNLDMGSVDIIVTCNASYGYSLYMTADGTDLTRTEAIGSNTPIIPTLDTDTTPEAFALNHWGYKSKLDKLYRPFNNTSTEIGHTFGPVDSNTENVTFAARVDSNTPAGVYNLGLDIVAIANIVPATIGDVDYMQSFRNMTTNDKTAIMSSMTEKVNYTLTDFRDHQTYTVAKLPDGNIWMTENLNIAGGTKLTQSTSNVSADYTLPQSSLTGFSDNATAYVYNSGNRNCSLSGGCYSYYSYAAATAGTNPSSGEATSDICPAGWRLPSKEELQKLITYQVSSFFSDYAGNIQGGVLKSKGSYGSYRASTAQDNANAWDMYMHNGGGVMEYYSKSTGFGVRCIAK